MKKILCALLTALIIFSMVPAASAAMGATWSGSPVVRPGESIALTFCAGGGIYGGSGTLSFDSSVLTLQSWSASVGGNWCVEMNGDHFVFYDNAVSTPIVGSSAIFKVVFQVAADVRPGTEISVTACNVTLSDGQRDTAMGSVSYIATVAQPLSENCDLQSLTISGATISPAFSPEVTYYTAQVPFEVSSVGIQATPQDRKARVSVNNPLLMAGDTTTVYITVTSEGGEKKVYTIDVTRGQDPDYVEGSVADLKSLTAEGYPLSPLFHPAVTRYYVWLPYEVDRLTLTVDAEDDMASCSIEGCPELIPGVGNELRVTVTAEDGTVKVYTVVAVRAPEHEKTDGLLDRWQQTEPTEAETVPATAPAQTAPLTQPPVAQPRPVFENEEILMPALLMGALAGVLVTALLMLIVRAMRRKAD